MPKISTDNYDTVASWNGSQDLFVVEQPDGTKVATPAMVKQYVLGNSIDDIYSVMGKMGAKNLIPYPYYEQTHEDNGITWTVNSDGSVTANGTATANSTFIFRQRTEQTKFVEKNTSYILSGCPSGGSNSKYMLYLFVQTEEPTNITSGTDYGNGVTINMPDQDYYGIYAFARVISGQTVSNLTFKPMLRLASDTDNTYEPYAKTNKELTEVIGDLSQTGLTGDSVADQLGTAGGQIAGINSKIGSNSGTLTQRIMLSASGNNSYTVTSDSAIMVAQFEGYLSAASDVFEANVQVNGLMIGYLGVREGVACNPAKREQIKIPFRVFKNDVIKITLSLTGSAVGYAALYTT